MKFIAALLVAACPVIALAQETLDFNAPRTSSLAQDVQAVYALPALEANATYGINTGLITAGLAQGEEVRVSLTLPGQPPLQKILHDGDPSYYLPFRSAGGGEATLLLHRNAAGDPRPLDYSLQLVRLAGPEEAHKFEAEPNDSFTQANPLRIGETIEGSADDVEYLDHQEESIRGLDWFRLDVKDRCLVMFELDVADRDVSVNLRMYTADPGDPAKVVPYLEGKDPMEIVHDREKERYSKSITRVFAPGTYYLEVNGNHPRYLVRSYTYPVPPYADPKLAVEVGSRYLMDVGDAWFAQIPREGNIYQRVQNMHETAMRCTACHPSVFSTEPNLVAHRNGYPIPSKQNFRYVVERIYNSIAPFYGPDDLYWQRFIAIPLQSQGKQGGILIDFEKQVSGRETPIVNRFGPLLRTAWAERTEMMEDELNGVMPKDSEFGFAWRDWRVLKDVYRRTGDSSYRAAADNLEKVFTSPAAEARVENLQDKMHYALGLSYMGRDYYRAKIGARLEELFALQNPDGSWHEEAKPGGDGAVYATGQMLYTMMECGLRPERDPRIERGLQWLLTQQQPFGGWFETDTHENFRTPMRESRYAVMALAQGYPKGPALQGLGNLDGGPAVAPAVDASPAQALAQLENILEVRGGERADIAAAVAPFLQRPEAPVRAAAAALLGRIGQAESVQPLLAVLDDPAKEVWRESAHALRLLGNRGYGVNDLHAALTDADPLVRRGAARAFAYQFQEMDDRLDIARTFVGLMDDPDLLTRLQAIRTLRQWWYRTSDPEFQSLIVKTFIDRMSVPEHPLVRTNLAQNMYILLDENQSGGVSMQRNIRDFPPEKADAVLKGRIQVEKSILLDTVLPAIANGNELQREALLESFDGSFFKGRYYARVPRDMIDVGNDREFSFMYEPEISLLDSTIGEVVKNETRPAQKRRGVQLASFFEMPAKSEDPGLQQALLAAIASEDPALRETTLDVVNKFLVLRPGPQNENVLATLGYVNGTDAPARTAVLASIARSPSAIANVDLQQTVAALADRVVAAEEATADLLPFVSTPVLNDEQALDILGSAWAALEAGSAAEKIAVVEALVKRSWGTLPAAQQATASSEGETVAAAAPADEPGGRLHRKAVRILQKAATDREVAVREKVFELLATMDDLRKSDRATPVLYAGLSDESPAIRARALSLARENDEVWLEEDVHEYVLKLLIDADPKIRQAALETVAERKLIGTEPRYAARVKAVMEGDETLKPAALQALQAASLTPESVQADAKIAAITDPDVLFFRDNVNHYFYLKGGDQNACADCHATHTILGLAESPKDGRPLTDTEIASNYRSILKVVNAIEPENSLILRKPRSPFGTGNADDASPTGITHAGGVRWANDTADDAYQSILAFIRTGQEAKPRPAATLSTDSFSPDNAPALAFDGNQATFWHTEYVGAMPGYPHELVLALAAPQEIAGVTYVPRQESDSGRVKDYEVYVSMDGQNWGEPVAKGAWGNDPLPKTLFLPPQQVKFVKLRGLSEVGNQPYMSAAELKLHVK